MQTRMLQVKVGGFRLGEKYCDNVMREKTVFAGIISKICQ